MIKPGNPLESLRECLSRLGGSELVSGFREPDIRTPEGYDAIEWILTARYKAFILRGTGLGGPPIIRPTPRFTSLPPEIALKKIMCAIERLNPQEYGEYVQYITDAFKMLMCLKEEGYQQECYLLLEYAGMLGWYLKQPDDYHRKQVEKRLRKLIEYGEKYKEVQDET